MSYKIEKEGFEMYGFKLGQMTKQGRIIGFDENDTECGIAIECESSTYKTQESTCVEYLLEGYEGVRFKWFGEKDLQLKNKIEIKAEIWDTTLIVQTLHCEPFEKVGKNGIILIYNDSTLLSSNKDIYLGCGEGNVNTDTYHFNTQAEAQSYLDTLLELIEIVNNPVPVVDLSRVEDYFFGDYKIISNAYQVHLLKGLVTVQSWNVDIITLPIIKSQLEQILAHLNVKAEVRI